MQWRQCGRFDLKLPVVSIGCWCFGGGDYWGQQNQQDVDAVVRGAVEEGCNFFDTAEVYNDGGSETSLGLALRGIPREKVILGTKISPANTQPNAVIEHCDASLRRLQTDYVDLYMVHWPITPQAIRHYTTAPLPTPSVPDAFAALMRLQQAGKVRHIGVSNFGTAKLDEALATGAEIVINELHYSLLSRAIELEILPYCREKGIGVLGYMALLQGVLSDTFPTLSDLPELRRRTRHFDSRSVPQSRHSQNGAEAETQAALSAIRGIARRECMSTAEISMAWAFAGDGITSSICGVRNPGQLQSCLKAASQTLAPAVIAELNRATQPLMEKLGPSFDYWESDENDRTR